MIEPAGAGQRLDRWLWFARLFKSRSLATKMVEAGAVRITRGGATLATDRPSTALKIGDVVTLKVHGDVRVLKVLDSGVRRGPPSEARALYEDLSVPSATEAADPPRPAYRPDKRERRALDRLKKPDHMDKE